MNGGPEIASLALARARDMVAEVQQALEVLGDTVTACQTSDLGALAAELGALRLSAEAALIEVTREAVDRGCPFDVGATSAGAWLAGEVGGAVCEREARTIGTVATAVNTPAFAPVRDALRRGDLGAERARLILGEHHELTRSLPWEMHDELLGHLVDIASDGYSVREIRKFRRDVIARFGRAGLIDKQQATLAGKRAMTVFHEGDDGMFQARLRLDPASHAVVAAALDALAAPKTGVDERGDVVRDERAPEQRRADAFVELCAAYPGLIGEGLRMTSRSKVVVTLSYADLVHGTGVGTTPTGEMLSPSAVRQMACDAGIIPLVLGSASEEIDVGREERLATPAQITALRHRDKGCTFPGCSRPPTWCRAHHIRHWADGGLTDMANLALLCQHHHTHVHRHGLTATVDDSGVHWHLGVHSLGRAAA